MSILPSWLDPEVIFAHAGGWAVVIAAAILFAECGLLIGFFLPGDTLLFIAGLLIAGAKLHTNLFLFIGICFLAAFAGNLVGYWIGYKVGPAVFKRPDAKLLKPEYIERTTAFFERWGKVTVVLARFVPVVRTVTTVMAGASRMDAKVYTVFSAIGGLLWVGGVTVAGYFLGQIPLVRDNVDLIFVGAVVVVLFFAVAPALFHIWQRRKATSD